MGVDSGALIKQSSQDLLLVIFIHGFRGKDTTFKTFPDHLKDKLSESIDNMVTECIVFPQYKTRGELAAVVAEFSEWLKKLVLEKEAADGNGGLARKVKIVLCGHSMGGLVAADALIQFVQKRPDADAPLWPRVIACLAFDTPYLGVHSDVFYNGMGKAYSKAKEFVSDLRKDREQTDSETTKEPTSRRHRFMKGLLATGSVLIAAAAVTTAVYSKREEIGNWVEEHMAFAGNLDKTAELNERLNTIVGYDKNMVILFRTFYTMLPADPPSSEDPRTFIKLPEPESPPTVPNAEDIMDYFLTAPNSLASGEVKAHRGMFEAETNDGYDQLESETLRLIKEAVTLARGIVEAKSLGVKCGVSANGELTSAMKEAQGTVVDAVRAS